MSSQVVASLVLALVVFGIVGCSKAVSSPALCEPGVLEEMPQHIRKVCIALENSNQLSNALTAYIKNEASALLYKPDEPITSNIAKRSDVDHVFLRFGRRR